MERVLTALSDFRIDLECEVQLIYFLFLLLLKKIETK
jgi:hypothetical protein